MNYYNHLAVYLNKINFGALALAFLLFFLPWTNVECSGKDFATQSGFQAIYGGLSLEDDFEEMEERGGPNDTDNKKDDIGFGLLTLVSFLLVLGGLAVAGAGAFAKIQLPVSAGLLAGIALVLLLLQSAVGFPIDRTIKDALKGDGDGPDMTEARDSAPMPPGLDGDPFARPPRDPFAGMNRAMSRATPIDSERTGWFFIELLVLALPLALYVIGRVPVLQTIPTSPAATAAPAPPAEPVVVPPAAPLPPQTPPTPPAV